MDDIFFWISLDSGFKLLNTGVVILRSGEIGVILCNVKIKCFEMESLLRLILIFLGLSSCSRWRHLSEVGHRVYHWEFHRNF